MLRDDWQYSRIFANGTARPGFTALLALRAELQQLLARAAEPGIMAMKLEWWRAEIERAFAGSAQHPVACALGLHLGKAGIAAEYCIELVDATETEAGGNAALSEQDFQLYLYRSGGVLAEQLAQLSGINERRALDAARRLGQLKRFTDLLLSTGMIARAGRWLLPASWLEPDMRDPRALLANANDAGSQALQHRLLDALDRQRVETRTAMAGIALPAALELQWALAQKDYLRLRDEPRRMFDPQPAKGNTLSRLWTAWRAARRSTQPARR